MTPHPVSACRTFGPESAPLATDPTRPRDLALEQEIMARALQVAERFDDSGLSTYADERAWPGGVRTGQNWRDHARQELGDCRHYLIWDTIEYWDAYLAGDLDAGERVAENISALAMLVKLWAGLPHR